MPYHETLIYEAHVRGLTLRHPDIPPAQRGTYAGLAHPAIIEHLQRLGVTAVELMPVHQFVPEQALVARGLTNYWGYNTIGFLAPHNRYSSAGQRGEQVGEFKTMVKTLHDAGIEVILDVVYNHTAEGNQIGPTLCFRGIDNASYYRLNDEDKSRYMDYTGCGNSLNVRHPHSLQLIMDSLRYWILEMHVDGFRFDLASALARELHDVDRLSTFFDLVQQDPVVSQVKLIAEPWDVGEGGYQVGNFPPLWTEWNGKYRDTVRDFWRGQPGTLPEFASRLTGSSDLYETSGRRPVASINFVTCHDGFTLADLVSYNDKHNEANGEDNRDGTDDNRSWNCGVEGPTDDPEINELRARQQRNFLTTLFCSQGVPMLLAGDEIGRTQRGNNNAYCQDNEISWVDWSLLDSERDLLDFTRALSAAPRPPGVPPPPVLPRAPARRRHRRRARRHRLADPGRARVHDHDWRSDGKSVAVFLNGDAISEPDPRGERVTDDRFLLLFNAGAEPITFTLPGVRYGREWEIVIDTCGPRSRPRTTTGRCWPRGRTSRWPGARSWCCAPGQRRQVLTCGSCSRRPGPGPARAEHRPAGGAVRLSAASPRRAVAAGQHGGRVDGAASVDGRSGGLSAAADHRLFGILRVLADVVLVGAGTARAEHYRPAQPASLGRRCARGRPRTPPIALISGRLDLDPQSALFTEAPPDARTIVITSEQAPAAQRAAVAELADVIVAGRRRRPEGRAREPRRPRLPARALRGRPAPARPSWPPPACSTSCA